MKLASCVVLYFPNLIEVTKSINSYIHSVDKLYIIDNTPNPNSENQNLSKISDKIEYFANRDNFGMAKALNMACKKAIEDGFEWIVSFDQDSYCTTDTIEVLKKLAIKKPSIGSVSPVYVENERSIENQIADWNLKESVIEVNSNITSCCLTNLEAYKKVGGFDETYFIDLVDTDFSFKLRESGYKVLLTNETFFFHSLGNKKENQLGKLVISYTNHSPIRRYYITRNRLYFTKKYRNKYPEFCKRELKQMGKEAAKILLFESQKMAKIKAMIYAFFDFYRGITGKSNREF